MGTVTYPDTEVQKLIETHFVPVQFNVADQPEVMARFNAPWTPTLIVQDAEGREHRRSEGYLDPKAFRAEMALARLREPINRQEFTTARDRVRAVLAQVAGDPEREPEVIYWSAVAAYKASNDSQNLVDGWNRLLDRFPQSAWARKAAFIRL
jgi:hypothetical protein